jgi:DNA-binding transcriptional MerR regulator
MKTVSNKDRKDEDLHRRLRRKSYYAINELAELLDVNVWTIRLWVNRFNILKPRLNQKGNLLFTYEDAEKIGTICHLTKVKDITLEKVRKYLEECYSTTAA